MTKTKRLEALLARVLLLAYSDEVPYKRSVLQRAWREELQDEFTKLRQDIMEELKR